MAEYLYHLLSVDHLLNVTVNRTQGPLLLHEEAAALSSDFLRDLQHEHDTDQHQHEKRRAQAKHGTAYRQDGHTGGYHVRQGLGDHLPQCVSIVGIMAHHVPVGVGIKILHRQGLHMGKHIVPDGHKHPLGYLNHEPIIGKASDDACKIDAGHLQQRSCKRPVIRHGLLQHGGDIIVNQPLKEQGTSHAGYGADEDAYHHQNATDLIGLKHIP